MRILRLFLIAALSLLSLQAMAQRQPVPIVNHVDVPVTTASGARLTAAQVKHAIVSAPAPRPWKFDDAGAGKLVGTLHVRGKHTIVVDISYAADKYSIRYRDSINMKYSPDGTIHPFYNQWVEELRTAVHRQLGSN